MSEEEEEEESYQETVSFIAPCEPYDGLPAHIRKVLPVPRRLIKPTIRKQFKFLKRPTPPKTFGNTIGIESQFVRIIADDGFRFILPRKYIVNSLILDYMLSHPEQVLPNRNAEVRMPGHTSTAIHWMIIYLMYKHYFEHGPIVPSQQFTFPPTLAFELIEIAHKYII